MAQPALSPAQSASQLYFDGKAVTARETLAAKLAGPDIREPGTRLAALGVLLDICLHSYADHCVQAHVAEYVELARTAPTANAVLQAEQARRAGYYFDAARLQLNRPEITAKILDWPMWTQENPYNGELYLQRRLLASNVLLAQGKTEAAMAEVDRILSFIAALKNPEAARFAVGWALTDLIRTLMDLGQTERAYGLYKASGGSIAGALGPRSVDAVVYRLAEGQVLQAVGDLEGASTALARALTTLDMIEVDDDTRSWLLGDLVTLRSAVCSMQNDLGCAREVLARHPSAARFQQAGATAGSEEDVSYLAARALTAALGKTPDPVAAQALAAAPNFGTDPRFQASEAMIRSAGAALALPPGPLRADALVQLGQRVRAHAAVPAAVTGAWFRPTPIGQLLTALALTQIEKADADDAFALIQIGNRVGPDFDADALTALGAADGELQRRAVHEALRLRARRDRLEREMVQQVAQRAVRQTPPSPILQHDPIQRLVFRDFSHRIGQAERSLTKARIPLSGANLIALKTFQAALRPNEAALGIAPTAGGLAYMCIRRDSTFRTTAPVDAARLLVDRKVLQNALTATHPPSEALDVQFPAEAAVRLYDVLLRPFAPCLKDGDALVWLPGVTTAGLPLSALLPALPPRLAAGYDLTSADWVVRHHAISYAGSAAALLAARRPRQSDGGFGFLGVGDPQLSGRTDDGQLRGQALLRGVLAGSGLSELAPLPETRAELEASAKGFRQSKVLLSAQATERGFRGELVGAYGVLSFATHGLIRDDLQGLSEPALVLTPVSAEDPLDDGLLTASEIADLNLGAWFVALSACNTANFDLSRAAQDLPALASAFAVAGTPSTLATLWLVNSETGQKVVSGMFEGLRASRGPAAALADAQRAFLAAPPGKAYLHPRFWAPFVILGDGAARAAARPDGAPSVTSVERLTTRGGEVLSVRRASDGVVTRFVAEPDTTGRRAAGTRLSGPNSWRRDDAGGAMRPTVDLGNTLVVGGYRADAGGRFVPALDALDRTTGAPLQRWLGEANGADFSTVFAMARTASDSVLVLTGEAVRLDRSAHRLRIFEADAALQPRLLFEITGNGRDGLDNATMAVVGGDLIITYTDRTAPFASPPVIPDDDYDFPLCSSEPVTWIERRDARTGVLKAAREVRGLQVETTSAGKDHMLLGGAVTSACGAEAAAVVLRLAPDLKTQSFWRDDSLGQSIVWSLGELSGGRLLVAASKQGVVDFTAPSAIGEKRDIYRTRDLQRANGGMVLVLDRQGKASAPRMLDSGAGVFINGMDVSRADDILLGGSLGGEAAIFHLTDTAGARR